MAFWESLATGGVSGLLKGAGDLAVKSREAVTGEAVLSAEQRTELLAQASAMEMLVMRADLAMAEQQTGINLAEAQSDSLFKGGWRPAVGWICVAGLAYEFLMRPIFPWLINLARAAPVAPMPELDMASLMSLILGMLGLGGLRSWEKWKGLAR